MININTYGPRQDISEHHPGLRAKVLVSQAISPPRQLTSPLLDKNRSPLNQIVKTLGHQYCFPYRVMISGKITNYLYLIWY